MDFIIEQYKAAMPENRKESIKILPICTLRLYDVVIVNSQRLELLASLLILFFSFSLKANVWFQVTSEVVDEAAPDILLTQPPSEGAEAKGVD